MSVQRLRQLLAEATPGPWVRSRIEGSTSIRRSDDNGGIAATARIADQALIVEAVNQLPALLDRLEAAETALAPLLDEVGDGRFGNKAEVLARWFDLNDERTGSSGTSVQDDLRLVARGIEAWRALRADRVERP